VIDQVTGVPSLKRHRASKPADGALALEEALKERMPERTLLEILARTAYWLEWWRRFGPASGSDPKLATPLLRYVLTTFTYGANLGPAQAARHIRGVSAHELGLTAARHFTTEKLNRASADVVNAYLLLDLVKAWGDGTSVAADGTQVDTLIDNLLAESHIRYGGYGGIAYHHIADNYIALFSHFIPCGVWEAVYIIEGLLRQPSDAEPDTIHADTQGQSYPVHALAHLFGFQLLTRIRNWKDLTFYRDSADVSYQHIDQLFGAPGENTINWALIETHWVDLMQVVLSIRQGRLSSTLLLRRLGTESRKNNIYKAFRELGRVIRTITLLRYISEPELREEITAATNKVESYNLFSAWLRFGHDTIERNDPAEQEKIIKFNTLLANCVIFHTALDMTAVLRHLASEGWGITPAAVAALSPYIRERSKRFGEYAAVASHAKRPRRLRDCNRREAAVSAALRARLTLPAAEAEVVRRASVAAAPRSLSGSDDPCWGIERCSCCLGDRRGEQIEVRVECVGRVDEPVGAARAGCRPFSVLLGVQSCAYGPWAIDSPRVRCAWLNGCRVRGAGRR
jgi:TnpA family transposase